MALDRSAATPKTPSATRRAWVSPEVTDLPRLTELTLQTGPSVPCGGGSGGGGSVVCP